MVEFLAVVVDIGKCVGLSARPLYRRCSARCALISVLAGHRRCEHSLW